MKCAPRLAPGPWQAAESGVEGPMARIAIAADAPCRIRLVPGGESPAYGKVVPAPVLECAVAAPAGRIVTFAMTPLDISATRIRAALSKGESVRYLLPDALIGYLQNHRLYTE